jgi:hypothetical protein
LLRSSRASGANHTNESLPSVWYERSPARDGAQLALQPSLPHAREGEEGVAAGERLPT